MAIDKLSANAFATGAIANSLGYTPANLAGADFTGDLSVPNTRAYQVKDSGGTTRYAMYMSSGVSPAAGNNLVIGNPLANSVLLFANNNTAVAVTAGGDVGIGITSPSARLHVAQSSGQDALALVSSENGGAYAATMRLSSANATGSYYNSLQSYFGGAMNWQITGAGSSNTIAFGTGSTGTERMRIDSGGRLLLGNTSAYYSALNMQVDCTSGGGVGGANPTPSVFLNYRTAGGGGQFNALALHYNFATIGNGPGLSFSALDAAGSRYTTALIGTSTTANTAGAISADLIFFNVNSATLNETMRLSTTGDLKFNSGYGSVATAYACRAWVHFTGSNGTINGSKNISYVTRNGVGDYTLGFSNGMADGAYTINGCLKPTSGQSGNNARDIHVAYDTYPSTSSFRVRAVTAGAGYEDPEYIYLTVHR